MIITGALLLTGIVLWRRRKARSADVAATPNTITISAAEPSRRTIPTRWTGSRGAM